MSRRLGWRCPGAASRRCAVPAPPSAASCATSRPPAPARRQSERSISKTISYGSQEQMNLF